MQLKIGKCLLFILVSVSTAYGQNGVIEGTVKDKLTGEYLEGAAIVVQNTSLGTITNFSGKFTLIGVPAGKQVIGIFFLGYETEEREIEIIPQKTVIIDFELNPKFFETKEVIVTAQARGQVAAIKQQLNARGIVNVVSAEKLLELPDVNVAEAIGRLPGITVQRDGGEGQKVIIRGFEPKYNTISINGLMAPSTDLNNRSTDLNLVSADIITGVEVNKATTADKDADGLGGNVNLVLKEALPGMKLTLDVQTGYSSQTNSFGHYKANTSFSNRFFKDKLGLLFSGSAESYDRSADIWENDFDIEGDKNHLTDEDLKSRIEIRKRFNGSLFLDFRTKQTVIKSSAFFSSLNRDYFTRTNNFDLGSKYLIYKQQDIDQTSTIISEALEGKHTILNMIIDWGIGKSWSRMKQPYNHEVTFRQQSAFIGNPSLFDTIPPQELVSSQYVDQQLGQMYLYDGYFYKFNAPESEFNAWLNLEVPFRIGSFLTGTIKGGAKTRSKNKEKDTRTWTERFDDSEGTDSVYKYFPDIIPSEHQGYVGITSFIDEKYDPQEFLNGIYSNVDLDIVLKRNMIKDLYNNVGRNYYVPAPVGHVRNDYKGYETVNAAYIMADLKIGKIITFVPGIRYERTYMRYTAFNGNTVPEDEQSIIVGLSYTDTTTSNTYGHWLPQIHLKIKPLSWLDLRLAYTNTLSRPDYSDLAPRMQISPNSKTVRHSGTYLLPARSENFDLILSLYPEKYGLFTLGIFHKNITGFTYVHSPLMLENTFTAPENYGLPSTLKGYIITYPKNNESTGYINGFETELQTNMNFLPRPFNGIVLSGNFTLMDSKTDYRYTYMYQIRNPDFPGPGQTYYIWTYVDTFSVDGLLSQAKYLANVSLGYDFKGFSARLSFSYTDEILTREQRRTDALDKEATLAFYRWDFQMKQKITKKLSVYFNIANIFNQPDRAVRLASGYYTRVEYYGLNTNIGIKYNFF